jgi:hypothetical protein
MIVARHRMNLGLAAQAAKGPGEDDPVMVFVKRAAAQLFRAVQGFSEAFAGKQGRPIQGGGSPWDECRAPASRFGVPGASEKLQAGSVNID